MPRRMLTRRKEVVRQNGRTNDRCPESVHRRKPGEGPGSGGHAFSWLSLPLQPLPCQPTIIQLQGELSKAKYASLKLYWSPKLMAIAPESSNPSEPSGHDPTTNLRNQNFLEPVDTERKSVFIFHFSSPPAFWIQRNNYNHRKELKLPWCIISTGI